MGAPTSPALSNLICIPLDQDLMHWSEERNLVYTRYADDLSFSGHNPIEAAEVVEIAQWIQAYDLVINPNKVKFYGPEYTQKEVTGLIVGLDGIPVPEE